jgi:hypothetical protein
MEWTELNFSFTWKFLMFIYKFYLFIYKFYLLLIIGKK